MAIYTYEQMQNDTESMASICQSLVDSFAPERQKKAANAGRSFVESLGRLLNRYRELLIAAENKLQATEESMIREGIVLEDLQLRFVDKTEAFHQQVYATVSTLVLALNNLRPHKKVLIDLPTRKLEKFLQYILSLPEFQHLLDFITVLNTSRAFRAKFIDHPQQHAAHNWYMQSSNAMVHVIYYLPSEDQGDTVSVPSSHNPYDEGFVPAVDCKEFYVSPNYHATFEAVHKLSLSLLSFYEQSKPTTGHSGTTQ